MEAQKRIGQEENEKQKNEMVQKEEEWKSERTDLNQKLQDLLIHNEKVKDECLKKVLVYKDKYQDYKQKVKRANQQISVLTQRVARYEVEKGMQPQSYGASPGKAGPHGASNDGVEDYDEEDAFEEEEDDQ